MTRISASTAAGTATSAVPGYPDYPIGWHFVAWVLLSIAGIVMFVRWPPRCTTLRTHQRVDPQRIAR